MTGVAVGHRGRTHISSTRDLARFGYLFFSDGSWDGKRIVSEEWNRLARTPGVNPACGFMNWFLNRPYTNDEGTRVKPIPAAPDSAVTFRGAGSNIIYIDRENDLVVVVQRIGSGLNELIEKVRDSIERPAATESSTRPR